MMWPTTAKFLVFVAALILASSFVAGSARAAPAAFSPLVLSRGGASDVVYLVATRHCRASPCVTLYRTNIGATHVLAVTLPPGTTGSAGGDSTSLQTLEFANVNDGYAIVDAKDNTATLYATSNGARTWRRVVSEHQVEMTIDVTSSEVFLSTTPCKPRALYCGQTTVRRSTLTGAHWITVPSLWTTGSGKSDVYYGPSVAAYASTVWELETANQADYLWTSTDSGRSFIRAKEPFPMLASVNGCRITPMSLSALWAECPTGMMVSFFYSGNGGATWRTVSVGQFAGTGGGFFDPVTSNTAYIDFGDVAHSNVSRIDETTQRVSVVGELACTNVLSVAFTDVTHGLAVCSKNGVTTVLERTTDGGATWSQASLPTS